VFDLNLIVHYTGAQRYKFPLKNYIFVDNNYLSKENPSYPGKINLKLNSNNLIPKFNNYTNKFNYGKA